MGGVRRGGGGVSAAGGGWQGSHSADAWTDKPPLTSWAAVEDFDYNKYQ